ncbi:MAG: nuclear transport factor 2 family protein, partial [candidate division WOR-3 bacterium]
MAVKRRGAVKVDSKTVRSKRDLMCRNWATLLTALMLAGCIGAVFTAGERQETGESGMAISVVRAFANRFGDRNIGLLLELFADDALLELAGLGVVLQGREELRGFLEFGAEVKARLTIVELHSEGETVVCRIREKNDWFGLLGADEVTYQGRFVIEQGRLKSGVVAVEPGGKARLKDGLVEFLQWL